MKITIVKENKKWGERYYAYRSGILSRLKIFCLWNRVGFSGADTVEQCILNVRHELEPEPPRDLKIIKTIEV